MAELGQQTVEFSSLVSRAAEESYLSLKELVEKSKSTELSDTDKKISLLKYIVKTQQRMLRLNVLAKWCKQVPLIKYCQELGSTLSAHDICFTQAADSLFFMHEGLQQARAPVYDISSAAEVLLTGSYQRLPKCIEDVGMQSSLDEHQQKPALEKLDALVRSKLLEITLPNEITEVKVSKGTATLCLDGEFKVLVTLGYRGHLSMWRILHLDLLVGERSGPINLEVARRHALGDYLERRMSVAENPFTILYSVLHELCVAIVMDTVIRQVQALRQGRWKDAIRFELISDAGITQLNQEGEVDSVGLRTPGVKLMYWLDSDKNAGSFIKIEPGSDLQIKCLHSSFVIDPLTGKEAEFSLDQSCIDLEKLLRKAICCNRYTRLLQIQKELQNNVRISRVSSDVILQSLLDMPGVETEKGVKKVDTKEGMEPEVLRVRAYGSSFFTLGVNIRTGRFLLQSSKSILTASILEEYEAALNQGSISAVEAFINLRSKSILHLFAAVGKFLGLEVYGQDFAASKVPKTLVDGSSVLILGFPDCGSSHLLLMELDKDFTPDFKLVETQMDTCEKPQSFNDLTNILREKKIDVGQMWILEDELNSITPDVARFLSSFPGVKGINKTSGHDPLGLGVGGLPEMSGSPLNFSSIIDEVFGLEKWASVHSLHDQHGPLPKNLPSINSTGVVPLVTSYSNGSLYDLQDPVQSGSFNSLSASPGKAPVMKKLVISTSDQDLASLRFPKLVEGCTEEGDQTKLIEGCTSRLLSPPMSTGARVSASGGKLVSGPSRITESAQTSDDHLLRKDQKSRKGAASANLLSLIPSLQGVEAVSGPANKRRKTSELEQSLSVSLQKFSSTATTTKISGCSYWSLIAEANKGNAPSSIFVYTLLHVVRHSSLSIMHAKLTSQMEAMDIQYVEEMDLRNASSNIWFRLPFAQSDSWQQICLQLGGPGSMRWDVKINDQHFRDLWELQKGSKNTPWGSGVRIENSSYVDFHISYDPEGVVLSYQSVEADSIKKLVADIQRLSNARMFALGMRKLLGIRPDDKTEGFSKGPSVGKGSTEPAERLSEQMRRAFKIEAVGLTSLWFSFGSGLLARFVVEWDSGKDGCTMHVSPDQLWPHTKFLEDFINGTEVASLLDCIRLTAGPLHALAAATRPARAGPASGAAPVVTAAIPSISRQSNQMQQTQGGSTASSASPNVGPTTSSTSANAIAPGSGPLGGSSSLHGAAMLTSVGQSGPGIVPSSLLPIDVSVVLRGPYWVRIIYRKRFAVDMRCFAGDQVWLQPATPPKGGASIGGSLPCPQFRPFIMEHVAQELNGLEPNLSGNQQASGAANANANGANPSSATQLATASGNRANLPATTAMSRAAHQTAAFNRVGVVASPSSALNVIGLGLPVRRSPGNAVPAHVRGELNTAIIGLGDDGGYGGGWVPLVALKKVLRGILKYLGVLWLFAQLPDLLREILGSILKENEGALLNLDQEQPALRFFVGGYVFAVSVHRVQLLLQVLSVKRFHHQQQQQQQQNASTAQEELTQSEIGEICDYFSRRVASEPYDASRVASFITLLTLPIPVLREFLRLIAWKKGLSQTQAGDIAPGQRPRIELCLENHSGMDIDNNGGSATKSNIHYDRPRNSVDFALTVVLDPAHIPHINAAGGAAWLPYCVSVRLRYLFGENPSVTFLGMEGSHGGRACWQRVEDWEKCRQRVARTVEVNGSSAGDMAQGKLRMVADSVHRALQLCLQGLRDGNSSGNPS
ncbi:PREDICTED: mediator of RNA polymerase II transcription subunit 14-like isoform X2 [Tarenaya hassleriana]|uniref:mediator of RNA polymerase II transcription subunit 14-like isoform X2 n=1 Tax=Tarenaya hassleriana TaxID=28532 RepID=UPI00053C625A|nr:PREDICTED: mediator of RNA polymerase II transcription subunit 14-like isoform X2 [Tarenaya hassleriana]